MEFIKSAENSGKEVPEMGTRLVSRVPELIEKKGWQEHVFVGHCMIAGLSDFTAKRIASGETKMNTDTLAIIASVLEVGIGDILIVPENEKSG